MLYKEIIVVSSQIHTKHTNTPCGQNVEWLNAKPGGIDPSGHAVCGRSPAGIVGSNPTRGMEICVVSVLYCQVEVPAKS